MVQKSFALDGSPLGKHVRWENRSPGFVHMRAPTETASATLAWHGNMRSPFEEPPFDWGRGSIRIDVFGPPGAMRYRPLPEEEWRQVIVDRDSSVLLINQRSMQVLLLSGRELNLTSEPSPLTDPGALTSSIAPLIAWGSGGSSITVYEVMATRRRPQRHTQPGDPLGRRRVIIAYDLDTVALARAVAEMRAVVEAWEEGIAATWSQCEQTTEGGETVVNDGPVRR